MYECQYEYVHQIDGYIVCSLINYVFIKPKLLNSRHDRGKSPLMRNRTALTLPNSSKYNKEDWENKIYEKIELIERSLDAGLPHTLCEFLFGEPKSGYQ